MSKRTSDAHVRESGFTLGEIPEAFEYIKERRHLREYEEWDWEDPANAGTSGLIFDH